MREKRIWTPPFGPVGRRRSATYNGVTQVGRTNRTWVQIATVLGYVLAVSLAAVVLAVYYGFIWKHASGPGVGPGPARARNRTGEQTVLNLENDQKSLSGIRTSLTRDISPVDAPIPSVRSSGASEPSDAGQGFTSPATSSTEPTAITAEDPSNLPTHRDTGAGGSDGNLGSGTADNSFEESYF